jgi:hypothetical protein
MQSNRRVETLEPTDREVQQPPPQSAKTGAKRLRLYTRGSVIVCLFAQAERDWRSSSQVEEQCLHLELNFERQFAGTTPMNHVISLSLNPAQEQALDHSALLDAVRALTLQAIETDAGAIEEISGVRRPPIATG